MTLEEAVQQQVHLGQKDPLKIARRILKENEEAWVRDELYGLRENLISEMARTRLNGLRRSAMHSLRKGAPKADLLLAGEWVPNEGWKKLADWTISDLLSREHYYRKMAGTATKLANWCRECQELIRSEGVTKLGQVKADLPAIPANGDLPAVEEAA